MAKRIVAGVDYSLASPAICIHAGNEWSINNCQFVYFDKPKRIAKYESKEPQLHPAIYSKWESNEERYYNLMSHFLPWLVQVDEIGMEDYAMRASGRVFHIAENMGLLKHALWNKHRDWTLYTPTTVKKFATGYGFAKKCVDVTVKKKKGDDVIWPSLERVFEEETGFGLRERILQPKTETPSSDIIDAYFICKMKWENFEI